MAYETIPRTPTPTPGAPESVLDQITRGACLIAQPVRINDYESFVTLPAGVQVQSLAHLRLHPVRVKESRRVADAASFIAYVERFKRLHTVITASRAPAGHLGEFIAIIDYHSSNDPHTPGEPGWCEHHALWVAEFDRRFAGWLEKHKTPMTQTQFAEWLDERTADIVAPPGAEVLEMIQWLEASTNSSFKSVINLKNGRTTFEYADPATLRVKGQEIELPDIIGLVLPIVEGGPELSLNVRLRYRLENERLKLFYHIPRLQDLLDAAWLFTAEQIRGALNLPFYRVK